MAAVGREDGDSCESVSDRMRGSGHRSVSEATGAIPPDAGITSVPGLALAPLSRPAEWWVWGQSPPIRVYPLLPEAGTGRQSSDGRTPTASSQADVEPVSLEWLTVEETARIRRVHHQTVRKAIKDGRLAAENWGSGAKPVYRIHRDARIENRPRSRVAPSVPTRTGRKPADGRFSALVSGDAHTPTTCEVRQ